MPWAKSLSQLGQQWLRAPASPPQVSKRDPYVRERGSSNMAMLDEGRMQVHRRGAEIAQGLVSALQAGRPISGVNLYTSPWSRTKETAQILANHLASAGIQPNVSLRSALAPQGLGEMEGQPSDVVAQLLDHYRDGGSDVPPPGRSPLTGAPGESTDHYEARLFPFIQEILDRQAQNPHEYNIIAAHSSDMKAVRGKLEGGEFSKEHVEPAQLDRINPDGRYEPKVSIGEPGTYLLHHGVTEYNRARPEMLAVNRRQPVGSKDSNFLEGGNANATAASSLTGQY